MKLKKYVHASQAAQSGTTTFIVDPHESANVSGCVGINYILEQTEEVPANDFDYAMEERRGMTVLIREGSAAKNLDAIYYSNGRGADYYERYFSRNARNRMV